MKRVCACAAAMLATVALTSIGAESPIGLTIRLYNSTNLAPSDLLGARHVAEPILRDAGMDVSFRQCGGQPMPGGVVDRCNDPLKPSEIVVRIIDAPRFSLTIQQQVFGVAHIVTGAHRGRLVTLYSDRIATAAARVTQEPGTLLGRVLAHEVGHLLLGTDYHGETGLMRADWPDDLLNRSAAKEWQFSNSEAVTMQHMLAASLRE